MPVNFGCSNVRIPDQEVDSPSPVKTFTPDTLKKRKTIQERDDKYRLIN